MSPTTYPLRGGRPGCASTAGNSPDHIASNALWRLALALVAAARGDAAKGERLAREAVEILRTIDMLDQRGDAHRILADVLDAASLHGEATAERREALRLYEATGVLPKIAEMKRMLS